MRSNPGSPGAVKKGCTCPVLDNCHDAGIEYNGKKNYYISSDCPLHKSRKMQFLDEFMMEGTTIITETTGNLVVETVVPEIDIRAVIVQRNVLLFLLGFLSEEDLKYEEEAELSDSLLCAYREGDYQKANTIMHEWMMRCRQAEHERIVGE